MRKLGSLDQTFDAVLKQRDIKIDEQADALAGRFHLGEEPGLVDRGDLIDGL